MSKNGQAKMSVTALGIPSPSGLFTLIGETIIKIKTMMIENRKRPLTKILLGVNALNTAQRRISIYVN